MFGESAQPSGHFEFPVAGCRSPVSRFPRSHIIAFGTGVVVALAILAVSFLLGPIRAHSSRELAGARQAAADVAAGKPVSGAQVAGIVEPAAGSPKYPFLRHRRLAGRALGGPSATPEDKLVADAATAAETTGGFARFLDDGRLLAAEPSPRGLAVVLTRPHPAPAYPFLLVAGLLVAGAVLTRAVRHPAGLAAGLAGLAVPALAWGAPAAAALIAATAVAIAAARERIGAAAVSLRRHRVAYAYLAPAALGMAVLVLVPFLIGCALGFYDHARGGWRFVGLKNFGDILGTASFWLTLAVTVAWTALNVAAHVAIGVLLALALREPWLRVRGLFRVLLILPWAIPNYITALIWRGMFERQFGAVNALLGALGLAKVSWFSHFATSFTANVVTNTWLGFPFMMVVALGALESIPRDMYEAAAVDGAGRARRFFHITLPHLAPALLPAIILGSIWTFNMFNVIYLVSEGKPAGSTDILVTEAYRWAFERGQRYGMAAAYATLIFLILVGWTLLARRFSPKEAPR